MAKETTSVKYHDNLLFALLTQDHIENVWLNEGGEWSFHDRAEQGFSILKTKAEILKEAGVNDKDKQEAINKLS